LPKRLVRAGQQECRCLTVWSPLQYVGDDRFEMTEMPVHLLLDLGRIPSLECCECGAMQFDAGGVILGCTKDHVVNWSKFVLEPKHHRLQRAVPGSTPHDPVEEQFGLLGAVDVVAVSSKQVNRFLKLGEILVRRPERRELSHARLESLTRLQHPE